MSIVDEMRAATRSFLVPQGIRMAALAAICALALQPVMASQAGKLSPTVGEFAAWAAGRSEVANKPWAVLDKKNATLFLFGPAGRFQASSPVLLGSAQGDDSVPGIGDRKISEIRPFERTTPAGMFHTEPGLNTQNDDIVWVDYDAAISMHRVRALKGERRLQRLASPTPKDNRISYGCINVPAAFYDQWIKPGLGQHMGVVYVLPETRSARQQFKAPVSF